MNFDKMKRKRIPTRVRSLLQKESGSRCPVCSNDEVEHHEVHHIDENPTNDGPGNLILLCRNCHGKVTAGAIRMEEIVEIKKRIASIAHHGIQLVSINIDPNCAWRRSNQNPLAFFLHENGIIIKHQSPIFHVTLINHRSRTVVLYEISLMAEHLYSGLSGIPPAPRIVRSIAQYKIRLPDEDEKSQVGILDPIEIPAGASVKFEIEVSAEDDFGHSRKISTRKILQFGIELSGAEVFQLPLIYLNTENGNKGITLMMG